MDFLMIGSLNRYIKNIGLTQKWERKKETNDFTNDEKKTALERKNEMFKKTYMEQKEKDDNGETLSNIRNKINAGAKLTPDEMKYLQVKDPQLYQKLKDLENEKKKYEKDLKKCKTKEDVEKLKFSKISAAISSINAVKNNPNIPESYKLEVAAFESRRLNEFDKITAKFVKSGEYDKLPTEAEKRKAEQDIKEAEAAETEKILHNDAEETKKSENTDNEKETEKPEDSETASKAETGEKQVKTDVVENAPELQNKEITRSEAESTPQAKKLKHAKAVYKKNTMLTKNQELFQTSGQFGQLVTK